MDYGPLQSLIGTWEGNTGMDVAPEPDGPEHSPYYETMLFEACGDVTNAEAQTLHVLRYHQVVSRQSTGEVFHNESGYLSWEPATGQIVQSLTIPRGVALVATGSASQDDEGWTHIDVKAEEIAQTAFMAENATTTAFAHRLSVRGDELRYSETTDLEIYGSAFAHTDENSLTRR